MVGIILGVASMIAGGYMTKKSVSTLRDEAKKSQIKEITAVVEAAEAEVAEQAAKDNLAQAKQQAEKTAEIRHEAINIAMADLEKTLGEETMKEINKEVDEIMKKAEKAVEKKTAKKEATEKVADVKEKIAEKQAEIDELDEKIEKGLKDLEKGLEDLKGMTDNSAGKYPAKKKTAKKKAEAEKPKAKKTTK